MDILDILLHILVAEVVILSVYWLTRNWLQHVPIMFYLLIINLFVWPIREIVQHWPDITHFILSPQSILEWVLPVLAGSLTIFYIVEDPIRMD